MKPIGILGIPFDDKSSFLKGAALGPDAIRKALHDGSSNFWTESGTQLEAGVHFSDLGNVEVVQFPASIEEHLDTLYGQKVISLGGDHSIAYPIISSLSKQFDSLQLLQLDAHTDLYDSFEGDKFSHACPFARILEDNLVSHLTQIGIRTFPEDQRTLANAHDVTTVTMHDWSNGVRPVLKGPLYISLDLDVFDPAFVPGVSHYEPGGLSPRDLLEYLRTLDVPLVGADIVELNPNRDVHGITAAVGAKFLKELIGMMCA